jgi:sporulation protein YlmC with PRC-barrel domain
MKSIWNAATVAAGCLMLATAATAAGQEVPTPTKPQDSDPNSTQRAGVRDAGKDDLEGRVCRATKLIDCTVKNTKGEKIGDVEDLIIDKDEGYVAYAVLSFGGFLGVGEKLFAIPFSKVVRTDDETCVVSDVSKAQLEKAPNFANDSWPTFDRKYGTTLHEYYQAKPYWDDSSRTAHTDPTRIDKDALDKDRLNARGMVRASKAIGTDVEDASGNNLGDVDDIVIDDGTGRVVYAVLSFGGFMGMGDKLFAIPWQSLTKSTKDESKMVLDVPKDRLKAAPGFDKKNWPNMADRRWGHDIHTYYGKEPFWNRGEKRDPNSPTGNR